ncbi:unnamed protein product [Cutaneotrichosporon oleaginosum]
MGQDASEPRLGEHAAFGVRWASSRQASQRESGERVSPWVPAADDLPLSLDTKPPTGVLRGPPQHIPRGRILSNDSHLCMARREPTAADASSLGTELSFRPSLLGCANRPPHSMGSELKWYCGDRAATGSGRPRRPKSPRNGEEWSVPAVTRVTSGELVQLQGGRCQIVPSDPGQG